MFRSKLISQYLDFPDRGCWDSMLLGFLSGLGDCGFIDKQMSYYRRHDGGFWHSANALLKIEMSWDCIDALDRYFAKRYEKALLDQELWIYDLELPPPSYDDFWPQWKKSLLVYKFIYPRLLRRSPVGAARLGCRLVWRPIRYVLSRIFSIFR